jgi:hypothetical protein
MGQNNREKIYNMLSPRLLEKKARRAALAEKTSKEIPAKVQTAKVSVTTVAQPNNVKLYTPQELVISPNEGKPAVNGQAQKLDIRPVMDKKPIDPGIAAIPLEAKKKPGRPKKR